MLNLKPWDVGTDSGVTYTSPDSLTTPREPIRRITTKFPADPSNPFYDPSGEDMKPLARLYLTRQRLYEKSCSDDSISSDDEDSSQSGTGVKFQRFFLICGYLVRCLEIAAFRSEFVVAGKFQITPEMYFGAESEPFFVCHRWKGGTLIVHLGHPTVYHC